MRILAVRGANLASLTSFDIDLTADPLASAGLFAITGDTGAGKSTMLDALCLALYGEYPRATVARGEREVDASGDSLAVKDARNILRRGAATGFAEADFVGRDGVAYRARWETRRARQKAIGKLQPVERSLVKLDGSATIATGIVDVEVAVIDRTGLTFDQFRRTVLLAQGEFDAFLLADEKARADLLEKITGTEVYSRISQAVHKATSEQADRIAHLETARGAVNLLDPEARTALEAEIAEAEQAAAAAATNSKVLADLRVKAIRVSAAKAGLVEAQAQLAGARAQDVAAAADRTTLVQLGRLAPVSAKASENRATAEAIRVAKEARAKADGDLREAQTIVTTAMIDLQKATLAEQQIAARLLAFEPVWREADAIDVEIATAKRELDDALKTMSKAEAEGVSARAAVEKLAGDREALRVAHDRLSAELEQTAADAQIAERGREIARIFMQRTDAAVIASNEVHDAETARAAVAKLSEQQALEHRIVIDATNRRGALSDKLKALRQQLAASDGGGAEEQDRALATVIEKTREAEAIAHAWKQADIDIAEARETIVTAKAALDRAEDVRRNADSDLDRRKAVRRELGTFAVLADATLSQAAEKLRESLAPQQPCPVCGSKSHPFATHDGGGSKLAREIAGRRDSIDLEIETLEAQVIEATEAAANARAQLEEAQRRTTHALSEKTRLAQTYAMLAKPLTAALTACRMSYLVPAALDMRTGQALAQIAVSATRSRSHFEQAIKRRSELRAEIERLAQAHEDLARTREAADERHKGYAADRIDAERRLAAAESRATEVLRTLANINQQLSPYLAAVGATPDSLDVDTSAVEAQINERGALFLARRAERERIAGRLQAFAIEEAGAKATVDAADQTVAVAKETSAQRQARLADLTAKRAKLLDGAPTDQHRSTLTAEREAAQRARAAAGDLQQKHALDFALAIERQQAAEQAIAAAEARHAATREQLAAAVTELGIAWADVEALMALPADTMITLSQKLTSIATTLAEAEKAVELRSADLAALGPDAAVDLDVATIDARLAALTADITSQRDRSAAARTKLELDADARAKVGSIANDIDQAKQAYVVWQAVDAAIGSSNGDRFRRYAQGVTLDHLTQLANLQLEALNPRYQLVRSRSSDLGLAVIDREMGDDSRPVRSLSGGERFLVSLALALALSRLEGNEGFVDTLFIDEGFGALDADTLDTAIDALEMLHSQGRKVGVVTHVAAMIERIAVQIRVEKRGQGRSTVRLAA